MSDELEQRLRRIDPLPQGVPVEPADGPVAAALLEEIMSTPVIEPLTASEPAPRGRRWPRFAIGGGVAALAAGGIVAVASLGGGTSATSVTYDLAASNITQMCLPVDQIQPDPGTVAFGGTVDEITAEHATIDVDTWFANGDADEVVLNVGDTPIVALDGVEFVAGQRYLVSVIDGTVAICGQSGPATPELEALFNTWYG